MPALQRFPGLGHELREVHVLAVGAEGHQLRKFSGRVGPEYVGAEQRAVAHLEGDVLVEYSPGQRDHSFPLPLGERVRVRGLAETSTKAIMHGSSVRLLQA